MLLGGVFALKYNAGLYVLVVLLALAVTSGLGLRDVLCLAAGSLVIPLALLAVFWRGGALSDLYQATIGYNLLYSGETYAAHGDIVRYLLTSRSAMPGSIPCGSSAARLRRSSVGGAGRATGLGGVAWSPVRGSRSPASDRDQRQPRPARILPAGAAGARTGGRDVGGARYPAAVPWSRAGSPSRGRGCDLAGRRRPFSNLAANRLARHPLRPWAGRRGSASCELPVAATARSTRRWTMAVLASSLHRIRRRTIRSTCSAFRLARYVQPPAQCLAVLLEPPGDRRLQRRRSGLRSQRLRADLERRRPAMLPFRSATGRPTCRTRPSSS